MTNLTKSNNQREHYSINAKLQSDLQQEVCQLSLHRGSRVPPLCPLAAFHTGHSPSGLLSSGARASSGRPGVWTAARNCAPVHKQDETYKTLNPWIQPQAKNPTVKHNDTNANVFISHVYRIKKEHTQKTKQPVDLPLTNPLQLSKACTKENNLLMLGKKIY